MDELYSVEHHILGCFGITLNLQTELLLLQLQYKYFFVKLNVILGN
jgi:hypothetical protein